MLPLAHTSLSRQSPAAAPRPPTPPRESDSHDSKTNSFFGRVPLNDTTAKPALSITPNSSAESPNQSTGTRRKRVGWDDEATSSPINPPVPSSGERKPIKSILKPYNGVNISNFNITSTSKLSPPHAYANLAAMLESIAQQLAGEDRNSRMDAYTTLSGTIKAYDDVPDIRALKEKMGLLQQFMKRDLVAKTGAGTLDTPLIINDLILLSSFLQKSAIAELLSSEFSANLVDYAIKTFQDPSMSKDVAKHLMFIISQQNFSAKVMNAERVGRLLAALHSIEIFVKGKSIVTGRLNIYRNLIRKSRSSMLANTVWIENLFSDLLSVVKDTRTHAIELGFEAALVLGTESRASRAVMDFFQRERKDEKPAMKYGDYFTKRLQGMIYKKQEGGSPNVPQVWSIVILFLRCRPRQLEQWAFMGDWLKVIQECFNCSDQQTKLEANLAWNRLVFAIKPDQNTSTTIISMLCRPLLEQLKRKGKASGKARRATLSSVCVLLYYSLKPNSPQSQLDQYWDNYVFQVVGNTLISHNSIQKPELARQDRLDACLILKGLFDSTTPRLWKDTRAMDFNTVDSYMDASELPPLDSKWLRKIAYRVYQLLHPLLEQLYWDLAENNSPIAMLWDSYITSIAAPAIKEIKVANETMACVASIFNFLYRIWHIGPINLHSLPPLNESGPEKFLAIFTKVIMSAIDKLGVLPFTEKLLSIGNKNTFMVISTPSHRPRNFRGEIQCPLHHLFLLLTHVCPGLDYDENFVLMIRRILTPFINARPSSKSQLELIRELLRLLPADAEFNEPCKLIWRVLAELATCATDTRDVNGGGSLRNNHQPLGADYRNMLEILEVCIHRSPRAPLPGWRGLFEALVNSATLDSGDGGRAIAIIEPLARAFTSNFSKAATGLDSGLAYCRLIVSKANYPKDRQALDAARRRLCEAATGGMKPSNFDPYTELYTCLQGCLETSYASFNRDQALEYSDVLSATTALLDRCPAVMLYSVYLKLQNGIACWILDKHLKLHGGNAYSHSITSLWAKVCTQIPNMRYQHRHSTILSDLEPLFLSGLESKHRAIINAAIRLWNATFSDCVDGLEYPPRIQYALLRLRRVTDLQLPFFPEGAESEAPEERQPLTFEDTQEDSTSFLNYSKLEHVVDSELARGLDYSKSSKSTPKPLFYSRLPSPTTNKRSREKTPEPGFRNPAKRVPTLKLRHDDSQIQFEAVDSSPVADGALESQLLTDRQKEVKERQQLEATMFPDLRSSPRPKGTFSAEQLPMHCSSSKSRSIPSPIIARQTTPTLILQVEDVDFINSSPTPTRRNTSEPPPLPKAATNKYVSSYEDDSDIPSSPPEIVEDQSNVNTTPLYPSAQIDPYAVETTRPLSTYDDTPNQSAEPKQSSILQVVLKSRKITSSPTSDGHLGKDNGASKPSQIAINTGIIDNNYHEEVDDSAVTEQAHKPSVFHDTLTSPASSDWHATNTGVFEDAVSSPRLAPKKATAKKVTTKKASSPISDFDESSMLRLVREYDQGSGRPRRSVRFSTGQENQSAGSKSPTNSPCPATSNAGLANESTDNIHDAQAPRELNLSPSKGTQSSSFPSLIPETPGIKGPKVFADDGEDLNPDETITVVTPDNYEPYTVSRRKRSRALFTPIRHLSASPGSRKRKHGEAGGGEREVPDSQDIKVEEPEASSPKRKSPSKRRRGQPRRRSRLSSQTNTSSNIELEPSQSFSLAGVDDSMDILEFDSTSDVLGSTPQAAAGMEGLGRGNIGPVVVTPTREMSLDLVEDSKNMVAQSFADRTIDDSDNMKISAAALRNKSIREEMDTSNMVEHPPTSSMELTRGANAPMQVESTSNAPDIQDMRGKLQSLIGELASAALTREEVNEFEDMFWEAKEKLYGAAKRGREAS